MTSKRKLKKENEELRNELATMKVWLRAYISMAKKQQDDIDCLNASLDAAASDLERWKTIARKADERRLAYVRGMASAD